MKRQWDTILLIAKYLSYRETICLSVLLGQYSSKQ